MKSHKNTFCKSIELSFSIIGVASTIAGVLGYTVRDIIPKWSWWQWLLVLLGVFVALSAIAFAIIKWMRHKPYKTTINGINVSIICGDLFAECGWKIIPFNEMFDTTVDDIIIARDSLNGVMIEKYVDDLNDLKDVIDRAARENSTFKPSMVDGVRKYPLGRLIPYNDFLLLSFSHFDEQNKAYIDIGEYEQLLFRMWKEVRRVYAMKPVSIPLLGTGITTIKGVSEKNYTEMLKCILCTLRKSGHQLTGEIRIILTEKDLARIDMNIIREEF